MKRSRRRLDRDSVKSRFYTNMARIGAITRHVYSEVEGLKQTDALRSEGVRADIFRAIVVFLHATFEDVIRSQFPNPNKKFSFYSNADLKKALIELKVDTALFQSLFPPLTQMAKRRNRIVHHADLDEARSEGANPWLLDDVWKLLQWNISVAAFYYRLLRATGPTNMVEERASQNMERALVQNVELAHLFIGFSKLPPEQYREGLSKLSEHLSKMQEAIKIEVEMFLGPDGEPIEGLFESSEHEGNENDVSN